MVNKEFIESSLGVTAEHKNRETYSVRGQNDLGYWKFCNGTQSWCIRVGRDLTIRSEMANGEYIEYTWIRFSDMQINEMSDNFVAVSGNQTDYGVLASAIIKYKEESFITKIPYYNIE